MSWFKKDMPQTIITEKVVMPDMSKYATSESVEAVRKSIYDQNILTNKEVASQFIKMSNTIDSIKKSLDEKKPDFSFFKGNSGGDEKYLQGLNTGFEIGLRMASTFDEKARKFTKDTAIEEALGRLNGNHTKTN